MTKQFKLPAPDAPAEEWGRLAASIPGAPKCWGDLEGRDGHDAPGAVCADGTWWLPDSADGMFLDVDHPATEGCLFRMMSNETDSLMLIPNTSRVFEWYDGSEWQEQSLPLGRACIAVAAALGEWPGGAE